MATTPAAYDYWNAVRTRISSTGIAMMPLSGPPPMPSVPIVLDGGSEFDIVVFAAGRWNAAPIIPKPLQTSRNRVFLAGQQSAIFPIPYAVGIRLYEISGWYAWGILNPEGLESDMPLGTPPLGQADQPLDFDQYLQMAGIQNAQLISQHPTTPLPTGDGSQPEQIPNLLWTLSQNW